MSSLVPPVAPPTSDQPIGEAKEALPGATSPQSQAPDALADFFGVTAAAPVTEVDKTERERLIAEARKDSNVRHREIHDALASQDESAISSCVDLGRRLLQGRVTLETLETADAALLGESVSAAYQQVGERQRGELIGVIGQRINDLNHGGDTGIFRELREGEDLQVEGGRRERGQQELVHLRAVLLGTSLQAFETGDISTAVQALRQAQVDFSLSPAWYDARAAEAIEAANLTDAKTRTAVMEIRQHGLFGVSILGEEVMAGKVDTPKHRIAKKVTDAEKIQKVEDTETARRKEEAEYQARMKDGWSHKMEQAVNDGETQFRQHLQGGKDYLVRFERSAGSGLLYTLAEDWHLIGDVTENHRSGGVLGYIDTLGRMMSTPGFMDKAVKVLSEKVYFDLGGRSRADYGKVGRLVDWESHIREQLLAEIHGNLFGFVRGAIQTREDDRNSWQPRRDQILTRVLMVAGEENAENLISGRGVLTREQQLFRQAMAGYLQELQTGKLNGREDTNCPEYLKRFQQLPTLAKTTAQGATVVRQRRDEIERIRVQEEERERQQLGASARGLQDRLQHILAVREDIMDLKPQGEVINGFNLKKADEYVAVVEGKAIDGKTPIITITMKKEKRKAAEGRIAQINQELQAEALVPARARELRDERAGLEVEVQFIDDLGGLVEQLNKAQYRRTKETGAVIKSRKGAIAGGACHEIAPQEHGLKEQIPFNWREQIDQSVDREVNNPQESRGMTKHLGTLETLTQIVEKNISSSDPLARRDQIRQTADDTTVRNASAERLLVKYRGERDGAVRAAARSFFRERVDNYLSRNGYLVYR